MHTVIGYISSAHRHAMLHNIERLYIALGPLDMLNPTKILPLLLMKEWFDLDSTFAT